MTGVLDSLLSDLRARGVRLQVSGDRLVVDAPCGALTEEDRGALKATKSAILRRLAPQAEIFAMSLEEFGQSDCSIEVWVPWLAETLWWVPRVEQAEELVLRGVHRGRVYTAKDLTNLTTILESSPEGRDDVRRLARLKFELQAEILRLEPPDELAPTPSRPAGCRCRACRGTRFWLSIHGVTVCGKCHAPASPDLVARWIEAESSDA